MPNQPARPQFSRGREHLAETLEALGAGAYDKSSVMRTFLTYPQKAPTRAGRMRARFVRGFARLRSSNVFWAVLGFLLGFLSS